MNEDNLKQVLQTLNQKQAAEHFGVHTDTVKRAIKRYGIKYTKKSGGCHLYRDNPLDPNLKLTKMQEDIMVGSLLGDGFLLKTDIFRIKQKKSRREYVDYLHQEFKPFSTPVRIDKARKPTRLKDGTVSHKLEHWKGGYAWSASFSTRKHKIFEDLRTKWYPDGKKIVPDDLELNPTIITHWYLQDGHHNKQKGYYKFSTQSFTISEVEMLSNLLNLCVGVKSVVQLQDSLPIIYITKTNGEDILHNLLMENVFFQCFKYKR